MYARWSTSVNVDDKVLIRPHTDPLKFNVVLEIDPEDYALGIAEMPYSWGSAGGMAALEAQAIAARS